MAEHILNILSAEDDPDDQFLIEKALKEYSYTYCLRGGDSRKLMPLAKT